jgi:Uma2 family endonuclease
MCYDAMGTPAPYQYDPSPVRDQRYEWINNLPRAEPPMGAAADHIVTLLVGLIEGFASERRPGLVFSHRGGYQVFPADPKNLRKPDAPFDRPPRGQVSIPPGLAVEVVSPNAEAEETDQRVADYLGAGVRLIWIIYPATRSVWVVRQDGTAARLTENQELSGEDVVPDFKCPVRDLFVDL